MPAASVCGETLTETVAGVLPLEAETASQLPPPLVLTVEVKDVLPPVEVTWKVCGDGAVSPAV